MIVVSLLLILVAVTLLVLGLTGGSSALLISSIVASLLAAVALVIGARQAAGRRRVAGGIPATPADDPYLADAPRVEHVAAGASGPVFAEPAARDFPPPRDSAQGSARDSARDFAPPPPAGTNADDLAPPPPPGAYTDDLPPPPPPAAYVDDVPPPPPAAGGVVDDEDDDLRPVSPSARESGSPVGSDFSGSDTILDPNRAEADYDRADADRADPDYDRAATVIGAARSSGPDESWRRGGDADPSPAASLADASDSPADEFAEPDEDDPADEPLPQSVQPNDAVRVARMDDEVYVVDGRPRYHLAECSHLAGRLNEGLPAREAVELGFSPCGLCRPVDGLVARATRH